jgi:phage baseplate assembly protein gpV
VAATQQGQSLSKRNQSEFGQNPTNRRGVVVDRDPKAMRVKVRFEDEDDVVTHWIDVTAKSSSGGVRFFSMPGLEDEVWCAMDAKGEAGCVLGSRYNAKETPPHDSNEDIAVQWPGGFVHINTGSGAVALKTAGSVSIEADGDIDLKSARLLHNGKSVGHDHSHLGVVRGSEVTGPPV